MIDKDFMFLHRTFCFLYTISDIRISKAEKKHDKRIYNKPLSCLFCEKNLRHRIQRHLIACHEDEKDVAEASAACGQKRKNLFNKIKNMGNFNHNVKVLTSKEGELHVVRRPSKTRNSKYLPCIHCYGFYRTGELWHHCKECPLNTTTFGQKQTGTIARAKLLLQGGLLSENLATIANHDDEITVRTSFNIPTMRQDHIYEQVENDNLIKQFGQILSEKLGPRRTHDIAQRMRQLGRLKIKLNQSCAEPKNLSHYITANNFDKVVESVQNLAKLQTSSEGIKIFEVPSLALRLGHNLLKCAEIKRGIAIRSVDTDTKQSVDNFIQLHTSEWTDKVSSIALASLRTSKFNAPTILPVTEDLVKLKAYLDDRISVLSAKIDEVRKSSLFRELEEVVMARILIFNKRRSSEVSQLRLQTFVQRPNWTKTVNDEILQSLLPVEKKLLERYSKCIYTVKMLI